MKVTHTLTMYELEQIIIGFYNKLGFEEVEVDITKDGAEISFEDDIEEFVNNY